MRPSLLNPLFAAVTTLPGVGPKVAKLLARLTGQEDGARVADLGPDSIVFELVGSPEEVDSFEELVRPRGLQELGRTGRIGLSRATRQGRSRSQQQVMV